MTYEKAGKIAAQALEYGKSLIKIDASLLEVTEKIEDKIIQLGAKPAFPVQLSINEIAAHYTAYPNDETKFKKNDLVKLDIGVHVNGLIGDNACTVDLNNNKELVLAAETALNESIKIIKPGTQLKEIGKVIEDSIHKFKFEPIRNLSGHGLAEYEQHSGLTIPNFDTGETEEVKDKQVIAIEPFATTGIGLIKEGKPSSIYRLAHIKNVRDNISREILNFIMEEYKTLPFCKRWLLKKFPEFKVNFALRILERENIIDQYSHLVEKSNGIVSQAEHTIEVGNPSKVLTNI